MATKATIETIRSLEQSCKNIPHHRINSSEAKESFLEFHKTAAIAFSEIKTPEAKPLLDKFIGIDRNGNGFHLRSMFDSVYTEYGMLMNLLEKEC